MIEFLDLQHYRDSLVAGLPYGVRKVVELARALATEPKLLLLDEPSSGLNVEETDDMAFWIQDIRNELGITVLMVEHDMALVSKVSDRVLAMAQGKVLALGTPAEVQAHPGVIEAYLGTADEAESLRRPKPQPVGQAASPQPERVEGCMSESILTLSNVESAYGPVKAIRGVSLQVRKGEIATVLGANGAGKSTILKTISGIIDPRKGTVEFDGHDITARDPAEIVRLRLCHVPEGREVFPLLSVRDNLMMGAYTRADRDGVARDLETVFGYFPILKERAEPTGRTALGRPAADARDQPRADGRPAPDPARRAEPGAVARGSTKEIFEIVVRINRERGTTMLRGRAERADGAQRSRPRLCARERPHRDGRPLRGAAREGRHQGVLPRHEESRRARRAALEDQEELAMREAEQP